MRLLLPLILFSFFANAASPASNPQRRVCLENDGTFWVLNLGRENETAMCFFNSAFIGAETLMQFKASGAESSAISAYESSQNPSSGETYCQDQGGQVSAGADSNGKSFTYCTFSDGSIIDTKTLGSGPAASGNQKLNHALGLQ